MTDCSIDGCGRAVKARGWCYRHYTRWRNHGDPLKLLIRPDGEGTIISGGYIVVKKDGKQRPKHVIVAEEKLGRKLEKNERALHFDLDKLNNDPENIVVCTNAEYPLLRQRLQALSVSGYSFYKKCTYCNQYDDPLIMAKTKKRNGFRFYHAACKKRKKRELDRFFAL